MNFFRKRWKEITLGFFVVIFVIPGVFALAFSHKFIITDTSNDWIGFWGSYIGAIIGGIITLIVLYTMLNVNKKERIEDEKIRFYEGIIKDLVDFDICLKDLVATTNTGSGIEEIKKFNNKALLIKLKLDIENEKGIHEGIGNVLKLLKDVFTCVDGIQEKSKNEIFNEVDYKNEIDKLKLCMEGLYSETKKMIVKNTLR